MTHGDERAAHEDAAVVERLDAHPGRQDAAVELRELGVQRGEDDGRVRPAPHEHDALDRLGLEVARHDAAARGSADRHAGHVADADGRPTASGHDDLLDVAGVVQRPEPADDVLLLAVLDVVPARVDVRAGERVEHLMERDAARLELLRVDLHLELLDEAAEGDDVGHAGHLLQVPLHHPVLDLAELHRGVPGPLERVPEYLAGRRRERAEARLHAVGHVHAGEPLAHLLAREVEVGAVVERQRHVGEAEDRHGPHAPETREPVQLLLDRQRDLALDLLRRVAGEERDHVHLRIGELREGLDRQVQEGERPRHGEERRQAEDGQRLGEAEPENATHSRPEARRVPGGPPRGSPCRRPAGVADRPSLSPDWDPPRNPGGGPLTGEGAILGCRRPGGASAGGQ